MPHIIVKLVPGRTEQQKAQLVNAFVINAIQILGVEEEALSVAIEDVQPEDWTEKVYLTDIRNNWDKLYKKPGYDPLNKETK